MLRFVGRAAVAGVIALLSFAGAPALAQTIPLTGGTYSQDFDTLSNTAGSTTNSTLPTGWLLTETGGGARDNEQYGVDTGSSNTGDTYSYGVAGSTERAFGSLRSGTLVSVIGACFTNSTGNTLTSLAVAYTGEEWRLGTAARTDRIDFQYSLDATSLTTGTWIDENALDFITPNTATTGAKIGNDAANRTALSATLGGLSIGNGATFCVRWNDSDASGADDGLAIDDFSINTGGVAVPALAVNDVTLIEGDSGTSTAFFGFGLSQPAGPGGVTIDYATADGTATAGSDYVAASGTVTIPQGSTSVVVGITINGDTTPEANETFFVNLSNVTGAVLADAQGLGTIENDDVAVVQIHDIQGNGLTSPINGAVVTTEGIVTALKFNNGFFLQSTTPDADPNTSEGIFVFTSTAPPATAAVGNRIRVTGTVTEFTPSTNLNQLSITEIVSVTAIQVLSTGNTLPAPVDLTAADFSAASVPGTAEKYEGMRVRIAEARVVSGSDGNISESSANSSTTGVFHVVLPTVQRPFREPGIGILDTFPIPGGKTPPRFDTNQERLMVRSRGQVGATSLALDAEAQIANMTGVMDYFSGTWALLPDVGSGTATGGKTPTAVADAGPEDVTIGGFNLLRFFDEINDSNGAATLTAAALDKRLTKTSLAICDFVKAPDILGVVEVENLRVLGLLADRINATCARAPQYVPYLVQGNDVGGINVGFLVSTRLVGTNPRVEVLEVTQFGKDTVFTNPNGSTSLLNDRPPLMLRAIVHGNGGATYPVTAIVNHLRSLNGIDDTAAGSSGWPTEGDRVRAKRLQQAVFLADLVQARQVADPAERIILLGDFNAFEFSDGYADVMGVLRGNAAPENQVIAYAPSPITRPLIDGSELIPAAADRYSYVFEGSAQTLDHVVLNEPMIMDAADIVVDHARINADFGVHNYGVAGNAIRVSDHDPVRVAISVAAFKNADLGITATAAPATVHVGGTATYTVTASNAGPGNAESASVALVFDAVVSPTVTAPAGWTCAAPVQTTTTTITCTTASFANGGSAVFTADVVAGSALINRSLGLQAAVASITTDPANGNNQASASVAVVAEADLAVTASAGGTIDVGGTASFTVVTTNNGPDNAEFASTALVFGALVSPTVTAPAGWTCAAPVQDATTTTVTCTTSVFANGGSATFTASVPTGPAQGGQSLALAAAVASQFTDPNSGNNQAVASVAVRAIADLAVTAGVVASPVQVGNTAAFTAAVANGGPNAANGVAVVFGFNALVTPTVTAPAGWSCAAPTQTASATNVACSTATLAGGANAGFSASFPATAALAGRSVVMTATATSETADTATANNTASATVSINTSADLAATVTATAASIPAGGTAAYVVTASNTGPSAATTANVVLSFNALISPTVATPAGWTCAAPVQAGTTTTVTCSAASFAASASAQFNASFVAGAALDGRTVTLTAAVSSTTTDPVAGNNQASASVQVASSADLSVRMIGRSERAGVFLLAVNNAGPSAAQAPTLTLTGNMLPRNVVLVPAAGWTCTTTAVGTGFRSVCNASGPLAAGTDAYFGLVLTGRGPQAVTVTATVASTTADPNTANNTASRVVRSNGLPLQCVHRYCQK
jgi:predicted extracellular nuclease